MEIQQENKTQQLIKLKLKQIEHDEDQKIHQYNLEKTRQEEHKQRQLQ